MNIRHFIRILASPRKGIEKEILTGKDAVVSEDNKQCICACDQDPIAKLCTMGDPATRADRLAVVNSLAVEKNHQLADLRKIEDNLEKQTHNLREKIDFLRKEIEELSSKIASFGGLIRKLNDATSQQQTIDGNITVLEKQLEELKQEAYFLGLTIILVKKDGTITAPNDPDLVLDDSGFGSTLTVLTRKENLQRFSVEDLKMVSKAHKISMRVENSYVVWEDEELGAIYDELFPSPTMKGEK